MEDDSTQCGGEEDNGEYSDNDTAIDGNGRVFVGYKDPLSPAFKKNEYAMLVAMEKTPGMMNAHFQS